MAVRWLGVNVSTDAVTVVDAEIPDDDGPIVIKIGRYVAAAEGREGRCLQRCSTSNAWTMSERQNRCRLIVKASAVMGRGSRRCFADAALRFGRGHGRRPLQMRS